MAITPSTILQTARDLLQDTVSGAYRYSDDDLYRAMNMALQNARRVRPDLFLWNGVLSEPPRVNSGNAGTPLSIDSQFEDAFVMYVTGAAELREDQFTNDGRAATLLNQFRSALMAV